MNKNNLPEIKTERLLLRRLHPSDWQMISFLRSDKKVNKFVKRSSAESKSKALEFIEMINEGIDSRNLYYWVVTEKNRNEMIGSICLWNFSQDNTIAEVGYDLVPKFQGKGIMSESLQSILSFGFKELNLKAVEAFTHKRNMPSRALLESNGFKIILGKIDEDNVDNLVYEIKNEGQ
ncbi:GNAT family N-acetyltransferase [Snuella sedimenti]|uniref:GNAT family N-acetyltransferase n=1 Tax=Snuella sedimenti TaxID=2798802 RepID=A0A8J7IUX7_9FLAO|nr:GNAT family N-acetyltransferase [Snuella sedimenti]MBJ6367225.1 GNAT family N-acetyltransferase [Snuella sedimenti]